MHTRCYLPPPHFFQLFRAHARFPHDLAEGPLSSPSVFFQSGSSSLEMGYIWKGGGSVVLLGRGIDSSPRNATWGQFQTVPERRKETRRSGKRGWIDDYFLWEVAGRGAMGGKRAPNGMCAAINVTRQGGRCPTSAPLPAPSLTRRRAAQPSLPRRSRSAPTHDAAPPEVGAGRNGPGTGYSRLYT